MDLDILGVIKKNNFYLSNFSLTSQLFIINLIIIIIGVIFLLFFNYYFILNDKSIQNNNLNFKSELNKISKYFENNAILRVPLFEEKKYRCRYFDENNDSDYFTEENCEEQGDLTSPIELSELELDKYSAEQIIFQNYIDRKFKLRIYNDNWLEIANSDYLISSIAVEETEISNDNNNEINIINLYKNFYFNFFNRIYLNILNKKYLPTANKLKHDIDIVSSTIRQNSIIDNTFRDKNNHIIKVLSSPISLSDKIYGVAIISYPLIENNEQLALQSINLFNFFLILIFVMVLLFFFFLTGLVSPLKELTKITILERNKLINPNKLNYPTRNDEIGILSNQIQLMSNELKSQMNQLEKFTADVAHELKNPLTAIKTSSELLLKKNISNSNKLTLIKNFNKDVNRMNKLISDISNFTRTIAEIEIEKFQLLNIDQFFHNFINDYSGNNKNITLIYETDKIKKNVLLNEDKLIQVILNLIDNSISSSIDNKKILIKSKILNKRLVEVKFYDQGKGINFKDKKKIFERFYTDRDQSREEHSGLGLSICKEIIRSFKGSIELTKSDNIDFSGACFIIKLPLKDS